MTPQPTDLEREKENTRTDAMHPAHQQGFINETLRSYRIKLTLEDNATLSSKVATALACINRHLFEMDLNVNWVLDRCGITSHTFYELFKCHTAMTIHQYIGYHRIQAARQLVQQAELSLTLISLELGYTNTVRIEGYSYGG